MPPRQQIEHALGRWRAGVHRTQRLIDADRQHADAVTIEVAVAYLGRSHTIADLVTAYGDHQDDAWLGRLCRLPGGHILNDGIVRDAAYWHRAQQLIAAAAEG